MACCLQERWQDEWESHSEGKAVVRSEGRRPGRGEKVLLEAKFNSHPTTLVMDRREIEKESHLHRKQRLVS